jgi:Holliday junction DNA helicase RuvA
MIANLQGRIVAKGDNYVIVNVGGVGFRVFVHRALVDRLGGPGQEVNLFTHMHVRENEIALYGCTSPDELSLFELLLQVSGIGPKVAMNIVSVMSTDALRDTIGRADAPALQHIPGVGKKLAERILLDLKDKLGVGLGFVSYPALTYADAEVISALTSLGYSIVEAQAALRSLPPEQLPIEERVRLALQYFATE